MSLLAVIMLYFVAWPTGMDPHVWTAPSVSGSQEEFPEGARKPGVERIEIEGGVGPAGLEANPPRGLLAAMGDGSILEIDLPSGAISVLANTGGRPIGLALDPDGALFVADAERGLLRVADGEVEVLTDSYNGRGLGLVYDVAIGLGGAIYFTEAVALDDEGERPSVPEMRRREMMAHNATGGLFVYRIETGETERLVDGLSFAAGVVPHHDGQSVLVAETMAYRVLRYWIAGDRRGEREAVLENLPGFPDGLAESRDGNYWVTLASPRLTVVDSLSTSPFLRNVVERFPGFMRPRFAGVGHVIKFDADGRVLADFQDPGGNYSRISTVAELEDALYIGNFEDAAVGRIGTATLIN